MTRLCLSIFFQVVGIIHCLEHKIHIGKFRAVLLDTHIKPIRCDSPIFCALPFIMALVPIRLVKSNIGTRHLVPNRTSVASKTETRDGDWLARLDYKRHDMTSIQAPLPRFIPHN